MCQDTKSYKLSPKPVTVAAAQPERFFIQLILNGTISLVSEIRPTFTVNLPAKPNNFIFLIKKKFALPY
jgi:hypothetical protein